MGFVLRELGSLVVHPQVGAVLRVGMGEELVGYVEGLKGLEQGGGGVGVGEEGGVGWHGHLLALYPVLVDCVCVVEQELRELLREVLHTVGVDMGLEKTQRTAVRKHSAALQEAALIAQHTTQR